MRIASTSRSPFVDADSSPSEEESSRVQEAIGLDHGDDDERWHELDEEVQEALRQGRLTVAATLAAGAGLEIGESIGRPLLDQLAEPHALSQNEEAIDLQQGLAGSTAFSPIGHAPDPGPLMLDFSEHEHRRSGDDVQKLIDSWALRGLIDGGAMIDVGFSTTVVGAAAPIVQWEVHVADPKQRLDPFHGPTGAAHWHYICPDPLYSDPARRTRWTRTSLRAALVAGTACALTVGQIIMLAGDHLSDVADLADPQRPRWNRRPVSIMDDFASKQPMATTVLDLWTLPPQGWFPGRTTINRLEKVHKHYSQVAKDIRAGGEWRAIEAVVGCFEHLRSLAPFAELHLLAQTLPLRSPRTLDSITSLALGTLDQVRYKANIEQLRKSKPKEAVKVLVEGIGGTALKTILTGGWYAQLAVDNQAHFAPLNWETFEAHHRAALGAVAKHVQGGGAGAAQGPIPARAIARTAYGLHFLTDAFSSGHMRVPRDVHGRGGSLVSGIMHDIDNAYGLNVSNGFGQMWRAFGDGHLLPGSSRSDAQRRIMKRNYAPASAVDAAFDENFKHLLTAVGVALTQLHEEAQRHRARSGAFAAALKAARQGAGLIGDDAVPADPSPTKTMQQRLAADANAKIADLRRHRPVPRPVGPGAIHNHPPLFHRVTGKLDTSGAYAIRVQQIFNIDAPSLRLYRDFPPKGEPEFELVDSFRETYHFARNSTGLHEAWLQGGDTEVEKMVRQLPRR